jgi:hypothetical protein
MLGRDDRSNLPNPAESRLFSSLRLSLLGESLLAQTQWRCNESRPNPYLLLANADRCRRSTGLLADAPRAPIV